MCFHVVYVKLLSNEMLGNHSGLIFFSPHHMTLLYSKLKSLLEITRGNMSVMSTANSIALNFNILIPLMIILQIHFGFTEPFSVDFSLYYTLSVSCKYTLISMTNSCGICNHEVTV
jgi:hypothetical protein